MSLKQILVTMTHGFTEEGADRWLDSFKAVFKTTNHFVLL
jgi:hypothetical protein